MTLLPCVVLGEKYFLHKIVPRAALTIQKVFRGHRDRKSFAAMIDRVLVERIDGPAAVRIQRIFRGTMVRRTSYEYHE
jgi:hypothetical protein